MIQLIAVFKKNVYLGFKCIFYHGSPKLKFFNCKLKTMCIAIIQKSKKDEYSFFIAINREEKYSRKWLAINTHWRNYPECHGYLDIESGGTWLAYNDYVLAILINKENADQNLKTRAFVVLDALKKAKSIEKSIDNLSQMSFSQTKPFNLLLVDKDSFWYGTNSLNHNLQKDIIFQQLKEDLVVINRTFPNDFEQNRVKNSFMAFHNLNQPNPALNQWSDWEKELLKECWPTGPEEEESLWLNTTEWGTLSSDIISISPNSTPPFKIHSVSKNTSNEY